MAIDSLPDELIAALETERRRVAAAAAESRQRLRARLDALEAMVVTGFESSNGSPVVEDSIVEYGDLPPPPTAEPAAPPLTAPLGAPAPEPAPVPEPVPVPEPALRVPHTPSYPGLVVSRRLLVFGAVVLMFVGYERWLSPWVGSNGQAQLRSKGAPTLSIPRLRLDLPVGKGVSVPDLRTGPGHDPGSSAMGERGNVVVAAHRTTYGKPFAPLSRLREGDEITLTAKTPVAYIVRSIRDDVPPDDRSVRAQHGDDRLTLVTASNRGRLVVVAMAEGERTGPLPGNTGEGGPLWPTNTTMALAGVALWSAAVFFFSRGVKEVKRRWGTVLVLLAVGPAACLVTFGLVGAIERVLGVLY